MSRGRTNSNALQLGIVLITVGIIGGLFFFRKYGVQEVTPANTAAETGEETPAAKGSCSWNVADDAAFSTGTAGVRDLNEIGPRYVLFHRDLTTYVFGNENGKGVIRKSYGQKKWEQIQDATVEKISIRGAVNFGDHGLVVVGTRDGHWVVALREDDTGPFREIDDFSLGGTKASANAVDTDAGKNVYVTGEAVDQSGRAHWVSRLWQTSAKTWKTIDDFAGEGAVSGQFAAVVDGKFAAAGLAGETKPVLRVNRSDGSWDIKPFAVPASARGVAMNAVQQNDMGEPSFCGSYTAADGTTHWLVSGSNVEDDFAAPGFKFSAATSRQILKDGEYVVGVAAPGPDLSNGAKILVRYRSFGGNGWKTVDEYSYPAATSTFIGHDTAMNTDEAINLAATALANGQGHWLFLTRVCTQ